MSTLVGEVFCRYNISATEGCATSARSANTLVQFKPPFSQQNAGCGLARPHRGRRKHIFCMLWKVFRLSCWELRRRQQNRNSGGEAKWTILEFILWRWHLAELAPPAFLPVLPLSAKGQISQVKLGPFFKTLISCWWSSLLCKRRFCCCSAAGSHGLKTL